MTVNLNDLINTVDNEIQAVQAKTNRAHLTGANRAERLRRLADRNTDAFVELARHYLPELTRRQLPQTWSEVRGRIEDILLVKEDRERQLQNELSATQRMINQLSAQCGQIEEELKHAKLVLSCKTGNFRKMMREDPAIVACQESIEQVDEEIECAIAALEHAKSEAIKKVPDYEQCHLFQYLENQKYGTPEYSGSLIERQWDRWVAKLIKYSEARKSYRHLVQTPKVIHDLIQKKQRAYQNLLQQLRDSRENAKAKYGVQEEEKRWEAVRNRFNETVNEQQRQRWHESSLKDELAELENVNCNYYDQAIDIYCKFLRKLEPRCTTNLFRMHSFSNR